jgi:hypothetical protein
MTGFWFVTLGRVHPFPAIEIGVIVPDRIRQLQSDPGHRFGSGPAAKDVCEDQARRPQQEFSK